MTGSDADFARMVHEHVLNALHLIAIGQADQELVARTLKWMAYGSGPPNQDPVRLADLVGESVRRAGVAHVTVEFTGASDLRALLLQPEVAQPLADALVEAVRNAHRHAHASKVSIRCSAAAGDVCMEIADDGRGLDHDASPGMGMRLGIQEAMARIGGLAQVRSRRGAGTSVLLRLPVKAQPLEGMQAEGQLRRQWPEVARGCQQLLQRLAESQLARADRLAVLGARIEDARIRAWLDSRRVESWLTDQAFAAVARAADRGRLLRLTILGEGGNSLVPEMDLVPLLADAQSLTVTVSRAHDELLALFQACESGAVRAVPAMATDRRTVISWEPLPDGQHLVRVRRHCD